MKLPSTALVSCLAAMTVSQAVAETITLDRKHGRRITSYFSTPHQVKAMNYWEEFNIIDGDASATDSVSAQVLFRAGVEEAEIIVPSTYRSSSPIGIYIHISPNNRAQLPSSVTTVARERYTIAASPLNAGNNKPDAARIARALDLVATLKLKYNIDPERVYIGGHSGGALISKWCGMLYPEVFKGVLPNEHAMGSRYWSKVFTWQDIEEMAANGQRWVTFLGTDSYAYFTLLPWAVDWEDRFDSMVRIVPGMGHVNAPTADFRAGFDWLERPRPHPEPWHFESAGTGLRRFHFNTQVGEEVELWRSTNLTDWTRVPGYPKRGHEAGMEYSIGSAPQEFFKVVSEPYARFVEIPAGEFEMGDAMGDSESGEFQHTVNLSAYKIQATEVTNEQMADVMNWAYQNGRVETYMSGYRLRLTGGSGENLLDTFSSGLRWDRDREEYFPRGFKGRGYPCVDVSWWGAAAYCNFLSEMEGLTPCYSFADWSCDFEADGYRLPTEAEWEKAARGGLEGKRFPWGDTVVHARANYVANGAFFRYDSSRTTSNTPHEEYSDLRGVGLAPVASFRKNGYGLYDVAGNVDEFCNDFFDPDFYAASPVENPRGPASGGFRIVRGGRFNSRADSLRLSNRYGDSLFGAADRGFRPVKR